MKARAIAMVVVVVVIGLALPCFAGRSAGRANNAFVAANEQYKLALHVAAHGTQTCTKGMPTFSTRGDLVRQWATYVDIDVFFIIFQYDEVTGAQYGLNWPAGWGTAATYHCADFAIGTIVNPGEGFAMTWTACQTPTGAGGTRPGFWPISWSWIVPDSDGEIQLEENPDTGKIGLSDCGFVELGPDSVFFAGVGVVPYEGPFVGTEPTTWGGVKAMFR